MTDKHKNFVISFIIPVLNGEKYMGQCLDHILREMDDNDEIIVVDNGSTDDTLKIVKQYKKVTVLNFPEVTIAALRNRGADIAKGDILAFIDSDCLVCDGWRLSVIDILRSNEISATGSTTIIPNDAIWVERAWLSQRCYTIEKVSYINSANFIIKKDIFNQVSGFNEMLITDEDTDICNRLNSNGYIVIDSPLIKVIHLDNSKNIIEFYKRQLWHATTLPNLKQVKNDKPFIATILNLFMFFILVPLFLITGRPSYAVISTIIIPFITVIYRVKVYRNYKYSFYLFILYFIFYLARFHAIIKLILSKFRK